MQRILILGASRYYLRSIETAKRMGYYTIVVDRNPDSPGFAWADAYAVIDISDSPSVLKYAREIGIDGIVPLNDFGVFTAAYVSENTGLHYINTEIAQIVINKAKLRKKWETAGQPNPKYRIVRTFDECVEACREIQLPVILKPAVSTGGGSRGVIVVENFGNIQEAYTFSSSFYDDNTILVEEFLSGTEHSAEVLIYQNKGHLLAVSDKIKTPLPYRVDKNVLYPTKFEGEQRYKLEQTIINAVEALEVSNGCAHVECCTLPSGEIKLFELGLRPGGGGTPDPIVTYVTGVNEFEQYLKLCVGERPDYVRPFYERGCNYHFITPKPGKVNRIIGFDDILTWEHILDAALFIKPGDTVKPVKVGSDRSGFIIAGGKKRNEAFDLGYKAEQHITFKYWG